MTRQGQVVGPRTPGSLDEVEPDAVEPKRMIPYPAGNNPEVRGWKRFLVILGIIGGFGCYLIPGLFGVRSYRRWKQGEIRPPTGWMFFGVFWVSCLVLLILIVMISGSDLGM